MKKKMSVMGVGHKIALPTLLWLAVMEAVNWFTRPLFDITGNYAMLLVIAIIMIVIGFSLNLAAAFTMIKAHGADRLATGGMYAVFRDPMYVVMILLVLPGLFLLLNSWLALTGVVPAYICYRVFSREEHRYLEGRYGDEYREYIKKVPVKI
jgi:protein-S-isoprenylcysteine O-methyltransferase Ste14